jgi:histone H3/H4
MSFTLEPLRRLIKAQGGVRVSDDACKALAKVLEEETKALALEAQKIATHAGRKTITAADVKLARKVVEAGLGGTEAQPSQPQPPAKPESKPKEDVKEAK